MATAEERTAYVSTLPLSTLTPHQLSVCADYILYGKDATGEYAGKSEVDRKNIYINTKYNSYKPVAPLSLDELMEHPNFEEQLLSVQPYPHYKHVKPTIDRERDADIPTMKELWRGIDALQHVINVNNGKVEAAPDEYVPKLTPTELYKLKHTLIDIRRDQYYLKDIFKPTRQRAYNRLYYITSNGEDEIAWNDEFCDYAFAPLGLVGDSGLAYDVFYNLRAVTYYPFNDKAKYTIDFRCAEHIYKLLDMYEELITSAEGNPNSLLGAIAHTLDYYIERANLKPQHYTIIELKKRHIHNKVIAARLHELYGLNHTDNYISTIWTKKICPEIAAAAKLHYDSFLARDGDEFWKRCSTCGIEKLRDNRNFVKRARALDGLSNRCKCCDSIARKRNKAS